MAINEEDFLNAALRPRFFFLDVGALIAVPLAIVHFRIWTVALVLLTMAFFWLLERRGLRPMVLLMMMRIRLGGLFRFPIHISRRRYHRRRLDNR